MKFPAEESCHKHTNYSRSEFVLFDSEANVSFFTS